MHSSFFTGSFVFLTLFVFTPLISSDLKKNDSHVPAGMYMGQQPPGIEPQIFAEDFISTEANEHGCTFSPDGKEFFFTRIINEKPAIMVTHQTESGWTVPEVASFSGLYNDRLPSLSPDGKKLFFESIRPWPDSTGDAAHHAWFVSRTASGWGQAQPLFLPLERKLTGISVSTQGRLFTGGVTVLEWVDNQYVNPQPLAPNLEGDYPFIAPDESYILFCVPPQRNLAVSFRTNDNTWSEPHFITSDDSYQIQGFPIISPCGKYIFFTANHDICWMDAGILNELKPKNSKQ